jgi:hypothetical protein
MTEQVTQETVEGAVEGALSGLRDDAAVGIIAKSILMVRGSVETATRDLEVLSLVAAAVRAQQYKYDVVESNINVNVSRTIPIGRHLCIGEDKRDDAVFVSYFYCTVRLHITRNHRRPSLEFISTDFRDVAVLSVQVTPTAAPPADVLQAVRNVVWAAAREPA